MGKEIQPKEPGQDVVDSSLFTLQDSNNVDSNKYNSAHQHERCANGDDLDSVATRREEEDDDDETVPLLIDTVSSNEPPYSVFPKSTRIFIIIMAALCGFVSPLSGNIYFPALNSLSADLHVSPSLINVSLTTYMIFQGLAPTFMGDLADTSGRRLTYLLSFTIYIGACIGLALQTSYPALLVLRCIQASGSSSSIALGAAVAADVATAAERGTYMGWVYSGALVGPAIAPVIGGILAQYLGWRAIFWFLVIFVGVLLIPLLLFFPETGRNVVGNGSIPPQLWNRDLLGIIREWQERSKMDEFRRTQTRESSRSARGALKAQRPLRFPNPLSSLKILREKDVALLLLYNSLVYSAFYSVTSSLPYLFEKIYHFDVLLVGLAFIPYGVGTFLASLLNGRILDWRFRRVAKSLGIKIVQGKTTDTRHFPLERARMPIALILILIGNSALLCYGWVLDVDAPLTVPLVLLFLIGYCIVGSYNCCSVALVDYYPTSPATATASNNLCRCLLGAGLTGVIIQMIDSMGRGWCFTLIAMVIYATTPILLILMRWGPKWREQRAQKIEEGKKAQAAQARVESSGSGIR